MKTFIAVLLLSTSSLAMAGGFVTVPNPYEQRPSPSYGNTGGFHSVPNPYEQRPISNYGYNHYEYERDRERERYNYEQKIQGNYPQIEERLPNIRNGRLWYPNR